MLVVVFVLFTEAVVHENKLVIMGYLNSIILCALENQNLKDRRNTNVVEKRFSNTSVVLNLKYHYTHVCVCVYVGVCMCVCVGGGLFPSSVHYKAPKH